MWDYGGLSGDFDTLLLHHKILTIMDLYLLPDLMKFAKF